MHDTRLTKRQVILLAAAGLREPFTANELVKAAWEKSPAEFALKPYHLPDSNAVLWNLMGDRGMVARGYLEKVGEKMYRLTGPGRREAERLARGEGFGVAVGTVQPGRDCDARLSRALLSKAMIRFRSGQRDTLNLADALSFWGAKPGDPPHVIEALRGVLERYVREAQDALVSGVCRFRSGQEVKAAELAELSKVNAWLAARFGRELERSRKAVPA